MADSGAPVEPENMFVLLENEAYAGISKIDWDKIIIQLDTVKSVILDDLEPTNKECDVCRQSFLHTDHSTIPEKPVSLPCGHVFGSSCLSRWIGSGNSQEHGENQEIEENEDFLALFRESLPLAGNEELEDLENLFGENLILDDHQIRNWFNPQTQWFGVKSFTCPKCRKSLTFRKMPGQQAAKIKARLEFWDTAYEKLGIVRSQKEEACRKDLVRLVEETKVERNAISVHEMVMCNFDARLSAMRFALRRGQWDLTPVQRHLRNGLFNLGCYGVDVPPEEYSAEAYEDRQNLPVWCWEFEKTARGMSSNSEGILSYLFKQLNNLVGIFPRDTDGRGERPGYWDQQRLGAWRRKMFAEIDISQSEYPWDFISDYDAE